MYNCQNCGHESHCGAPYHLLETDYNGATYQIKVCDLLQFVRHVKKRILKMAKEHFKFDFEPWMAEELIPETIGKIGTKQCLKYFLYGKLIL